MKTNSIKLALAAAVTAGLTTVNTTTFAATAPFLPNASDGWSMKSSFQSVRWEEVKVEKLRHAYYLLEHTDRDYSGHRIEAMHSIKKAAEILGVELKGWHEPHEEGQWESDHRVREAKRILEELQDETHGQEQAHVHRAVKELGKALAIK